MARIGILTCSNATQDLGCSSVVCLADLRKRKGAFAEYPAGEPLDLVGIINCPGCPTLTGADKLLHRIRALTEFRVQSIHFSNCVKVLCPFREKYREALEKAYPDIRIVLGTHQENISHEEFGDRVKGLFNRPGMTMIDLIFDRDRQNG